MITLKTKEIVTIPTKRGVTQGIVYLEIEALYLRKEYIRIEGNYHYFNDEGQKEILDKIDMYKSKELIDNIESQLQISSFYDFVNGRINQFALLQIQVESGENYGTTENDWEISI